MAINNRKPKKDDLYYDVWNKPNRKVHWRFKNNASLNAAKTDIDKDEITDRRTLNLVRMSHIRKEKETPVNAGTHFSHNGFGAAFVYARTVNEKKYIDKTRRKAKKYKNKNKWCMLTEADTIDMLSSHHQVSMSNFENLMMCDPCDTIWCYRNHLNGNCNIDRVGDGVCSFETNFKQLWLLNKFIDCKQVNIFCVVERPPYAEDGCYDRDLIYFENITDANLFLQELFVELTNNCDDNWCLNKTLDAIINTESYNNSKYYISNRHFNVPKWLREKSKKILKKER